MLRELKTLIAVARDGTFAAAGERIGLTQAAVSAQIKRLENELGHTLFDRNGRTARLNEHGKRVLQQAQELVLLYSLLGSETEAAAAAEKVSIGAIASAQRLLLPQALAQFHRQYPRCRTHVVPGISMELLNRVDAGELDMAVVIRPPFALPDSLQWISLAHEPYRLIAPRGIGGEDWRELLTSQPFIRYDRTSFGGRQVDRFLQGMHITVKETCEVDELDTIVRMVALGVGVAVIPQTASFKRWPKAIRAIDLQAHTFYRDIGLVHHPNRSLSDPAQGLTHLIGSL